MLIEPGIGLAEETDLSTLNVNGTDLAVFRRGRGEPVLFVHGSSSDHRTWEGQVNDLADSYEAIKYSRRYHRPNAKIEKGADYNMAEQADDLEALISALDVGPVHLVGHSYGGVLGLIVAGRAPDLFRSLVLEEPPAFNLFAHDPPKPLEIIKLLLTRPRLGRAFIMFGVKTIGPAKKAAKSGDFETADRLFGEGVLGADAVAALGPERALQAEENSFPEEILGSGFMKLDPQLVRGITCRALVMSGEKSPALWPLIADELAAHLPNSQRLRVPAAGHIIHEDNAPSFNSALLSFLAGADRLGG